MSERKNGPEFDEVLAGAMKRFDAPEGFAAKVMAAAEEGRTQNVSHKAKVLAFPKLPVWLSGAVAAMLVVGCALDLHVKQQRERAQATQEFELSMQITDHALAQTREQLQRAGISLDQQ